MFKTFQNFYRTRLDYNFAAHCKSLYNATLYTVAQHLNKNTLRHFYTTFQDISKDFKYFTKEIKSLQNYSLLILYQPNPAFSAIFKQNELAQLNTFIITGTSTDFNFLNQQQTDLQFKVSEQNENYLAHFENDFFF